VCGQVDVFITKINFSECVQIQIRDLVRSLRDLLGKFQESPCLGIQRGGTIVTLDLVN